jgi:zinc transport system substrate-binding protein
LKINLLEKGKIDMFNKLIKLKSMHFVRFVCAFLLSAFILTVTSSFAETSSQPSHSVVISVAPHRFFVQKIAGDTIKMILFVPANASSHAFEPTPKQMLTASQADMWFGIGEPFESRALVAMQQSKSKIQFVDLRKNLALITTEEGGMHSHHHCCHADSADLHIWLSARLAKIQAQTIAEALIAAYPENTELYTKNLKNFQKKLDDLDQEITQILAPLKNRVMMVSHPAYGYFARDYHIKQLSIEFEGKEPAPRQLTTILENARKANISTIFTQMQYNNKGANLIAKELHAKVVMLDPYSENYIESMRQIAHAIAAQET